MRVGPRPCTTAAWNVRKQAGPRVCTTPHPLLDTCVTGRCSAGAALTARNGERGGGLQSCAAKLGRRRIGGRGGTGRRRRRRPGHSGHTQRKQRLLDTVAGRCRRRGCPEAAHATLTGAATGHHPQRAGRSWCGRRGRFCAAGDGERAGAHTTHNYALDLTWSLRDVYRGPPTKESAAGADGPFPIQSRLIYKGGVGCCQG